MATVENKENEDQVVVEQKKRKKCFIISPFGPDGSEIRSKAEGLIAAVIKPVLQSLNFDAISSLDISIPGSISNQVIERLLNDDLVVANLTGLNPNVMYELAVRHAKRLPVVCLVERTTNLPFDINHERTFFYDDDMKGVITIQPVLEEAVKAAMEDKEIDNPIYRVVQQLIIQQDVKPGSPYDYIMQKLNQIEERMLYVNKSPVGKFVKERIVTEIFLATDEMAIKVMELLARKGIIGTRDAINNNAEFVVRLMFVTATEQRANEIMQFVKLKLPDLNFRINNQTVFYD